VPDGECSRSLFIQAAGSNLQSAVLALVANLSGLEQIPGSHLNPSQSFSSVMIGRAAVDDVKNPSLFDNDSGDLCVATHRQRCGDGL